MSFASRNSEPQRVDGRVHGEPHTDSQTNFRYCISKLQEFVFYDDEMSVEYQDSIDDPNVTEDHKCIHKNKKRPRIVTVLKCIFFSWNELNRKCGCPISFHCSSIEFQGRLSNALNWAVEKGYAQRIIKGRVKESLI